MRRNPYRIGLAILATIAALPCLGFCAVGALHAQEDPERALAWTVIYVGLDLALLALVVWIWTRALRPTPLPSGCPACGYDLSRLRTGSCPECGQAVRP